MNTKADHAPSEMEEAIKRVLAWDPYFPKYDSPSDDLMLEAREYHPVLSRKAEEWKAEERERCARVVDHAYANAEQIKREATALRSVGARVDAEQRMKDDSAIAKAIRGPPRSDRGRGVTITRFVSINILKDKTLTDLLKTHPHYLMVYGTLKPGHGNNYLIEKHNGKDIGPCRTVGKFVLNDGFPYVWQIKGRRAAGWAEVLGHVVGHLYKVSDAGLEACDRLEGSSPTLRPDQHTRMVRLAGEAAVHHGGHLSRAGESGRCQGATEAARRAFGVGP